ncbi:MAG: alpha/beta hydrolase, partial [Pseudomonadota bacterium]
MAEPVVFLPGMMCDARVWMPQIIALSTEYAVQVAPITKGETVEEIARHVLTQLPERFALAGLSMGGIVAMEMLRVAPERVTRVALFDTNCQQELPNVAAAREPQIVAVRSGRLPDVMKDVVLPEQLAPGPQRLQVLNAVMDMGLYLGADVFIRQSRALQKRPDQQGTLRRAKTPALIACGEYDTRTPPRIRDDLEHGVRHQMCHELVPARR